MLKQLRALARDSVVAGGERLGLSVVPMWRARRQPMAQHLSELFSHLAVDCVLDVGANVGQYRDFLRDEVGYEGRIVSFEPIPEHVEAMQRRALDDPHWQICGLALGAAPGEANFNIMAGTEFSSFLEPSEMETRLFQGENAVARSIPVRITTVDAALDSLREVHPIRRVYLKMDTQGHDLEVLRGAVGSMPRIAALQTEASIRRIYAGAPHFAESVVIIEGMDFSVSGIFPNNVGHFPLLIEVDCVFIANRHLS